MSDEQMSEFPDLKSDKERQRIQVRVRDREYKSELETENTRQN